MTLVSKTNTYNETAFDVPWWKGDTRLGFDPPEGEAIKRETEWLKQFQKQKTQLKSDWEDYEKELSSPTKEKDVKEKEDKKKGGWGFLKTNVKKLVRHGIPSELRGKIWFEKSGALKKKQDNTGVYANYVKEINEDAPVMEEIQMDIARTFTMHLMFANQMTKRMMLRILSCFTIRNPNYGYCQNMTFIVGMILFFLPEEDAFWLFVTIMEDILPVDFCSPTLIGLRVDQKVLEILVQERLPKLHAHFTKFQIDISCFTTSWLLRLFVNVFPIETTLRIWDCFLFEGSKILFRVALAFLKLHDEQMKQCTDSGEVMTFLSSECKLLYDADRLIKACGSFWALRRRQINDLRTKFIIDDFQSTSLSDSSNLSNHISNNVSHSNSSTDDEYEHSAKPEPSSLQPIPEEITTNSAKIPQEETINSEKKEIEQETKKIEEDEDEDDEEYDLC